MAADNTTGKPEIMVLNPVQPAVMAGLEARYHLLRADLAGPDNPTREAFIAQHGANVRALLSNGHTDLTIPMLDAMPKLAHVSCSSAGYDSMPAHELAARGIALSNASPALRDDVADMGMLLMLAASRNFTRAEAYVRSRDWAREGMFPLQRSISGKRLGIVGMGSLGQAVAQRAEAFNMRISYWNRRGKDTAYHYQPDLIRLAQASDILILTVAGGPETTGLIGAEALAALGPDGLLVNIARGSVVDEEALIAALKDGRLGHAALDVFAAEPDADPRLTSLGNVTLSPHHASGTVEARRAMAELAAANLDAFMTGKPLISPVAL
ncbi:MAG: 2-hydroxyacid dehydrogenase [Paracoccus sp. (in: a-proteobacteria)]|nr:2-hydroxyacid dehydrogenase [Paracoccus sp. (in: a-proteobacteria)]